jgi:hypothetical protein
MLRELERERAGHARLRQETIAALREKIDGVDECLARLMEAYVQNAVSLDEYRPAKNRLIGDRRSLEDQLVFVTKNQTSWLEPAIKFIKAARSTDFWARATTDEERREMLKNVGSNLTIADRKIHLVPRGAWKTVVDPARFGRPAAAAHVTRAAEHGEPDQTASLCCPLDEVRTFFTDNPGWA